MANRIHRSVSISTQAEDYLQKHPRINASALFEEAVWRHAKTESGVETKEAYLEKVTQEARAAAAQEFEKQQATQAGLRAPYEERLNSLTLLWKQAVKKNGVGSSEELEVSSALDALVAEAKAKGVVLVKPEYAQA